MVVHDDVESEPALTPSKEGTLIVRQVPMLRAVRGRAAPVVINPRAHPLTHAVSPLSSVLMLTRPGGQWGRAVGGRRVPHAPGAAGSVPVPVPPPRPALLACCVAAPLPAPREPRGLCLKQGSREVCMELSAPRGRGAEAGAAEAGRSRREPRGSWSQRG